MARLKASGGLWQRYSNWWLFDLPPLHGILRFAFYTVLLLYLLNYGAKDPLSQLHRYAATDPDLFVSFGLVKLLHIPYIDPRYLHILAKVTKVAWVFSAVGLLTRPAMIVTAVGFFCLHGMCLGTNALNHNWFLPMYALIALCFARSHDRWSVDYYLNNLLRYFGWRSSHSAPPQQPTLADTGFARKLFLVFTAGFYFASGSAKLLTAGHIWHDGHTVNFFTQLLNNGRLPLTHLFAEHLWLSDLSASISLLVEVGAIAMIFSRRSRYLLIPGLVMMHVGIKFSMGPDYSTNVICLMLLVNWGSLFRTVGRKVQDWRGRVEVRRSQFPSRKDRTLAPTGDAAIYRKSSVISAVVGGSVVAGLMVAIAFQQIFWWPFTNVYMYSSYFSVPHDIRADYPREDYYQADRVQAIAQSYLTTTTNIEATEYFSFRVALRLVGDNEEPLYLYDNLGVYDWKQWILTLVRPALVADFAAKPAGRIEFDPADSDYPAQQFLSDYAAVLQKSVPPETWQKYQRVEIVYPLMEVATQVSTSPPLPDAVLSKYKRKELVDLSNVRLVPIASVEIDS